MAVEAAPAAGRALEEEIAGPPTGGRSKSRDKLRHGALAVWSVLALLYLFIPATGDFINAALLGTPRQFMIGNVIQSKFLVILDYPTAAALSFILMSFILVGVFLYARVLGTKNLTEAAF